MNLFSRNQRRYATLFLIAALLVFLVFGLSKYLIALFGSVIFYKLFQTPFYFFTEKLKWNKHLVVILIILVSLVIIIIPFFSLAVLVTRQIVELSNRKEEINEVIAHVREFLGTTEWLPKDILSNVFEKVSNLASHLVPSVVNSALDIFITVTVLYFVLYYMFVQEERFLEFIYRYSPFRKETNRRLNNEMQNVVYSNIVGQAFISLVQGGTLSLGFWIFGFSNPLLWGLVAFFVSFLPVIGTPLVWWPAGIIGLANQDYFAGFGIIIYGFVITTQIDNVLRFMVNKWVGNIHPLITVLGVLFGLPMFGILGLVIGPLTISYFLLLLRAFYDEFATWKEEDRNPDGHPPPRDRHPGPVTHSE